MRRRSWVIVVAAVLVLMAAQVGYWRLVSQRLRAGYKDVLAGVAVRGWNCESGPVAVSGWPLAATLTVPNLALRHTAPSVPGDVNIAAAGITVSVSLLDPGTLVVSSAGPVHLRAGGLPDVIVTAGDNAVSVPLRRSGPLALALHASGLRLEPATGAWHVTAGLVNGRADIGDSGDDKTEPAATFAVSAEAIALPGTIKWPLGPNISSVSVDGRLNGPLPASRDITQWAEAWRDGGGSLEISHFTIGWGPLGLTSSATLALDDQLQPMGSGNGRIVGYAEALDRLASAGLLTKSAATAAKAVLSLMAGTSDADEPSSVDVPLTLQYRTLSMRQVPLVRLPELDWPTR